MNLSPKAATTSHRVPIEPQHVDAPLASSATFLVLSVSKSPDAVDTISSTLAGTGSLAKNVAIRDLNAAFAYTVGIGSDVWDGIAGLPRPAELHPFPVIRGATHTAVSTPGDLLFHIFSERRDLNFEFERKLIDRLGDAVTVVDSTTGFRYFDVRDLLSFVDGTANPVGSAVPASILIADDDIFAAGGSFIALNILFWAETKGKTPEEIDKLFDGQVHSQVRGLALVLAAGKVLASKGAEEIMAGVDFNKGEIQAVSTSEKTADSQVGEVNCCALFAL